MKARHCTESIREATDRYMTVLRAHFVCLSLQELHEEIGFARIADAIIQNGGNQCHAAQELRVHRNTLARYVRQMCAAGRPDPRVQAKQARKAIQSQRKLPLRAIA